MEIQKGQKVKVICSADQLKGIGIKQKHIKHIVGQVGTVKEIKPLPNAEGLAYFIHFKHVNLKPAPGNRKPYYTLLLDMIEPIGTEGVGNDGKKLGFSWGNKSGKMVT